MKVLCVTLVFCVGLMVLPGRAFEPAWARWVMRAGIVAWAIWLQRRILDEGTNRG